RGMQQLAQLGEIVALLERADGERALLRAAGGPAVGAARWGLSSVSSALHAPIQSRSPRARRRRVGARVSTRGCQRAAMTANAGRGRPASSSSDESQTAFERARMSHATISVRCALAIFSAWRHQATAPPGTLA